MISKSTHALNVLSSLFVAFEKMHCVFAISYVSTPLIVLSVVTPR
jgi:hypothetical protein